MKTFLVCLLASFALASSSAAFPQVPETEQPLSESDCRTTADMVRYVATLRDKGFTRESLEAQMRGNGNPAEIRIGLKVLHLVYGSGSQSTATQLYHLVLSRCMTHGSPEYI